MKNKEMKLRRKKGKAEAVSKKQVKAPVRWQSSPSHPATHLAYITDAERELLANLDLHGSGVSMENPHYGPKGIPSLNGMGGPGTGGSDNGTGGMGPGGRGGTDGYGGRDTGGSSSGRGSTGQGGRDGGRGGDGTGNSGSRGNTGGASSGFGGSDGGIGGSLGGRGGGYGGSVGGGGMGANNDGGIGGSLGSRSGGRAGGGFSGGNSGVGLGVGGLGGGIGGLGGGGYSGPKGGVIGPSDIGRAISGLAGTNAGRMGLAQASNALAGMRNSVSDVAWGGGGFFGEQPSTNVIDKRDDGPLPGIAPGAFGNLGPVGGLGGLFASGAAPSVAQQVSNAAAKGNLGQMVNRAAKGDFTGTPTAGAPGVSGGAANAGALGGMANAANVGLNSNVAAKSDMGVPSLNSRSNMAGLIASQGFGTPRETRSTPIGLSNLSQNQIDNTIASIVGLPGASFTGLSPTGAFATNSPQAANIARSDAMQGLPSAQGYSQPTMTATAPSMSEVAAQVQSPTMSASMSPRNRASLAPAMAAIGARNAAPASTDLSQVPGAYSNTTDTSGYTDVTDEARNIAQGNYMDAFKGGLEKLGLGNTLSIGGLLAGMGNPNARTGRSGENRGGNDDGYYVRGLLEAMNPRTPAPEAPDTVRPGNWVPPGLLMRPNPFPTVWQNRNPWQGYP